MITKSMTYGLTYWSLVIIGAIVFLQALKIAWNNYEAVRPTGSIKRFFLEPDTRGAYYAWWGLVGSMSITAWHVMEIVGANSVPAYWPRVFEWLLWAGVHMFFNYRIGKTLGDAELAE